MDLRDRIEIYIPAEAEVKSIPLWSLPSSVLGRMGLPLSDSSGSKKLANSPKGTWISPAVVRRKGQKPGNAVLESTSSLLRRECRASSGPFQMSFVFSNRTAFNVLRDAVPGNKLATLVPRAPAVPQGLASKSYQTAVVIHAGRIYLSVRTPGQRQGPQETAPSASQPLRKACGVKSKKKELLNDKKHPKKKRTSCKVTRGPKQNIGKPRVKDVSSSTAAPHSAVGVPSADSHCHEDAGAQQNPEEAALQPPNFRFEPQEEQQENGSNCESSGRSQQDLRGDVAGRNHNHNGDGAAQADGGECDGSWSRREPLDAAGAPASLQSECDYAALERDEAIARTKARMKPGLPRPAEA